jgi:hypothetical protein
MELSLLGPDRVQRRDITVVSGVDRQAQKFDIAHRHRPRSISQRQESA